MDSSRRWKRLWLAGAGVLSLAVILWAAYLFTAVWLRVQCARELAAEAQELPQLVVADGQELSSSDESWNENATGSGMWIDVFPDFFDDGIWLGSRVPAVVDRLEELQQPNLGIVWKHLVGRPREQELSPLIFSDVSYAINSPQIVFESPETRAGIAVFDATEAGGEESKTETPTSSNNTPGERHQVAVAAESESGSTTENQTDSGGIIVRLQQNTVPAQSQFTLVLDGWWPANRTYSVVDSDGEKTFLVGRRKNQASARSDREASASNTTLELLIVDSSGRILDRREMTDHVLLGKLPQPLGKADQLIFGRPQRMVNLSNGRFQPKPPRHGTVFVVEGGLLKKIRQVELRDGRPKQESSGEPPPESPDATDQIQAESTQR